MLNGQDVTDACRLAETRIAFDSSRRITTANLTIMGRTLNRVARYDYAHYDQDTYAIALRELYEVVILDGRDGVTKLFDGQIYALEMEQSDAPTFEVFYKCDLNDWAVWLDRSVCWDSSFPLVLPNSDQGIILALLGKFCPKIHLTDIGLLVPVIMSFDWMTKTCRQVLDDICSLSMGTWRVDFDANLHYGPASAAPLAPFALSTSPDYVTSFPVKVSGYRHDFSNPVNRAYVRGAADTTTGLLIEATYADPVSIQQYGEYASAVVDDQITTAWDASLRAKSTVLQYAFPVEQGNFTIWQDGLECGMRVSIHEDSLGIDGDYTIRALTMQWEDQWQVRYEAQFGAAQPDLETILRLLEQRAKWKTSNQPVASVAPGSVTDASIAPGGLHAGSIATVNAGSVVGLIQAGQIGNVNATSILGQITAGQITSVNAGAIVGALNAQQVGSVNATSIQGVITATQIGSVNATTIQGVILSSQLGNQIIDNLAKYVDALRPVPMIQTAAQLPALPNSNYPANTFFYYVPDGHFYQITANGLSWFQNDNPKGTLMSFYYIGAISAQSIIGVIVAAQIQSITAGQITGLVQAGQIAAVNASSISGQLTAGQIATVNASTIQGTISGTKIDAINANQISGTLSYYQIGSINAATITINQITDGQIANISGGKLYAGSITSDKLDTYALNVGGLGNMPGRINVYSTNSLVAQVGYLDSGGTYGGWFQVFGAGGSGYYNAKVRTDTSGNLYITDASLSITSGSFQIHTSPVTFDQSYGSLALIAEGYPDKASFISRGMVIYYAGSNIGALVRAPGGGWGELTLQGGSYVYLSGNSGVCRADGGFQVGGYVGVTEYVNVGGVYLRFVNGMYAGH